MVLCDMKRSLWTLILFALLGVLCAQLLGKSYFEAYGYLGEYQLQCFADADVDWMDLFWNILWGRAKLFVLFALVCATWTRHIVPIMAKVAGGFLIGFFVTVCVIQLGWIGILFFMVCMFPHIPCYLIACGIIYGIRPTYSGNGKRKNIKLFLSVLRICLLCVLGCTCETLIGTRLIKCLLAWMG